MRISIVVPVYNCALHLRKCLESIQRQTYHELEVIVVDDGSDDGTTMVCADFEERDTRFHVLTQENSGTVVARNRGLAAASGQYVVFVDADDWLGSDSVSTMVNAVAGCDADVAVFGYVEESARTTRNMGHHAPSGLYAGEDRFSLLRKMLHDGNGEFGVFPSLWAKIYERKLLLRIMLKADPRMRVGEDAAVIYELLSASRGVLIANDIVPYHYRRGHESLTDGLGRQSPESVVAVVRTLAGIRPVPSPNWDQQVAWYTFFVVHAYVRQAARQEASSAELGASVPRVAILLSDDLVHEYLCVARTVIRARVHSLFRYLMAAKRFRLLIGLSRAIDGVRRLSGRR